MKRFAIALLFLALALPVFAQNNQPCLAVYPVRGNQHEAAYIGAATMGAGLLLMHGERFDYLESTNLSVASVKTTYKKKELVSLEKQGVKIVVTTKEAFKAHKTRNTDGTTSSTDVSANLSAGCE